MREQKRESLYLGANATAQIVTLTVTCDQCHQARLRVRSLNRLEVEAAKAGWSCRKRLGARDRDLCPAEED